MIILISCLLICNILNVTNNTCIAQDESGNEYYVDSSYKGYSKGTAEQPFKTIQEAIDYAQEGDTLYVFGGKYKEAVDIDKQLRLWGGVEGTESIIEANYAVRHTVEITADYVEFQDFTITDASGYKTSPIGALVSIQADNVVVSGNTFDDTESYGIQIASTASGSIVTGNIINDTSRGIQVDSSETNDIFNNEFTNIAYAGIYLNQGSNNRLYENTIESHYYGIYGAYCHKINISNNTFSNIDYTAVYLLDCEHPLVQYNTFIDNDGVGVYLDANYGTVKENTFDETQRGISLVGTSCTIKDNVFTSCMGAGIYAFSNSQLNTMYNNSFENNGNTAEDQGNNNKWYNETLMVGNYWDDYNWVDRNKDGIGDITYTGQNFEDIYPLGFFLFEPNKPSSPSPSDQETGVGLKPVLKVKVVDEDTERLDVFFYNAETDKLLGTDIKVTSGHNAEYQHVLEFDTTYAWYAIVNDSIQENRSDTFFFTTMVTPPDNIPPVANAGGPYSSEVGEIITFDASESYDEDGDIDFYRWNFGDGTSELLAEIPTHTYHDDGIYTITLTVIDNLGAVDSEVITVAVGVDANKLPFADPSGPYSGEVNIPILFDGTGSYDENDEIQEYTWVFGDGTSGNGATISHSYAASGSYQVVLTVTDQYGESHAETTIVNIQAEKEDTPGFNLILLLISLMAIALIIKKKKE